MLFDSLGGGGAPLPAVDWMDRQMGKEKGVRGQTLSPICFAPREGSASFVQRPPKDSEKRAGGRAKTWGVWGVSPHMGGKAPHMQKPSARKEV